MILSGTVVSSESTKDFTDQDEHCKKSDRESTQPWSWRQKAIVGLGAVTGGAIALTATAVAAPIVLPAIGFSTTGVVAGSAAAAAQSAIGNVAAGSLFAALQSVGAVGGFSMAATGAATATGTAVGAGVGAVIPSSELTDNGPPDSDEG